MGSTWGPAKAPLGPEWHFELHYRKGRGWFQTDGEPFDIKGPWLLTIRCRRIGDLPA